MRHSPFALYPRTAVAAGPIDLRLHRPRAVPDTDVDVPVILFLHGGGFTEGVPHGFASIPGMVPSSAQHRSELVGELRPHLYAAGAPQRGDAR